MGQIHEAQVALSTVIAGTLAVLAVIGGIAIGTQAMPTRWGVLVMIVAATSHALLVRQWLEMARERDRRSFEMGLAAANTEGPRRVR